MADIVSLLLLVIFFFLGFIYPKKIGWIALFLCPLLGPTTLTIAGSSFLPLTIYRVFIMITFGVLASHYGRNYPLKKILKSNFVKILAILVSFIFFISLKDRAINMIFTFIPNIFCSITLCFVLIRTKPDLIKFTKFFVYHASIISILIIIEFYTEFNFTYEMQKTIPGLTVEELNTTSKIYNPQDRTGIYRPGGLDGSAGQTGFRLAFLFPLTLWFATRSVKFSFIHAFITLIGLFHLQTRASWFAIIISFLYILTIFFQNNSLSLKKKILSMFAIVFLSLFMFFIFQPRYYSVANDFIFNTIPDSFNPEAHNNIEYKIIRWPAALKIINQSPIWGHLVSRHYAESYMFWGLDLPSPFVYLLSGGAVLLTIYLSHLFFMPLNLIKISRSKLKSNNEKIYFLFVVSAFIAGIFCIFTNYQEAHFLIMYMLYISIYKVFVFSKYWNPNQVVS